MFSLTDALFLQTKNPMPIFPVVVPVLVLSDRELVAAAAVAAPIWQKGKPSGL